MAAAGVHASPPSLCTESKRGVTTEASGAREVECYGQSHTACSLCGGHTHPYLSGYCQLFSGSWEKNTMLGGCEFTRVSCVRVKARVSRGRGGPGPQAGQEQLAQHCGASPHPAQGRRHLPLSLSCPHPRAGPDAARTGWHPRLQEKGCGRGRATQGWFLLRIPGQPDRAWFQSHSVYPPRQSIRALITGSPRRMLGNYLLTFSSWPVQMLRWVWMEWHLQGYSDEAGTTPSRCCPLLPRGQAGPAT